MNQVLKDAIYGKGTSEQIEFMARLGGMNEEELTMFKLFHQGKSDIYIQQEMNISRKTYSRIEEAVRAKLTIAMFTCINKTYDMYSND